VNQFGRETIREFAEKVVEKLMDYISDDYFINSLTPTIDEQQKFADNIRDKIPRVACPMAGYSWPGVELLSAEISTLAQERETHLRKQEHVEKLYNLIYSFMERKLILDSSRFNDAVASSPWLTDDHFYEVTDLVNEGLRVVVNVDTVKNCMIEYMREKIRNTWEEASKGEIES